MHQAHTIPWNLLASHFVFMRDNPHRTPHTTDIFPVHPPRPNRATDLMHFTRVFADAIRSFSKTERGKLPSAEELRLQITQAIEAASTSSTNTASKDTEKTSTAPTSPSTFSRVHPPKLFHDTLLTRYPKYLTTKMQNPLYWVKRARVSQFDVGPRYSTSDGDLADAIKVLMYATDSRAVLCLTHLPFGVTTAEPNPFVISAPPIPPARPAPALLGLSELSWGHSFGFNRIVDGALWAYIYLNLSSALDLIQSGIFMETRNFARMFRETTEEKDYCAQQLPHRDFWEHIVINGADPSITANPAFDLRYHSYVPKSRPLTDSDLEWMERYLKELFRLIYVYDMVMRECGVEVQWEQEIIFTIRGITQAKVSMKIESVEFL